MSLSTPDARSGPPFSPLSRTSPSGALLGTSSSVAVYERPVALRDRLILSLDVDDLVEAVRLAEALRPWFGVVKVGLELFAAAGPEAVSALRHAGFEVFVDLKLSDVPATVYRTARIFGAVGARYLTLHAHNGIPMLRAGVEGFAEGAANAGLSGDPVALAVTVLSTDTDAPPHIVPGRVEAAAAAGCGGLLCVARDLDVVGRHGPGLLRVVTDVAVTAGEFGADPDHLDPDLMSTDLVTADLTDSGPSRRPAPGPGPVAVGAADLLVVGSGVTMAASPARAAAALFAVLGGGS